jgi:SAM-dependent methyltransferase
MKEQLFETLMMLLPLRSDSRYNILDFGCGTGELLYKLYQLVAKSSNLIGFDSDEKSIEKGKSLYTHINFHHAKFVDHFDLPDSSFDIIISVDALECIPDKVSLLKEFHRILKPGGQVLIAHWDWDTQVYSSEHKEIIRKIVASFSDWQQGWMDACDGQMGRKLWGIFQGSGLFKGHIEIFSLIETEFKVGRYGFDRLQDLYWLVRSGRLNMAEHQLIIDEMKDIYQKGKYFYSINSYIYAGIKV